MKLFKILAVAALMVSGTSFAQSYVGFEFSDETKRSDDSSKGKAAVVIGTKVTGGMDYSLKVENSQTKLGDGDIGSGVEVRAKKTFGAIGSLEVSPYIGVRLGEKVASDEHFSHYAVDYGVKLPIIGKIVYLDLGGRYRDAFNTINEFQSNRAHALVSYKLTDKDTIGVRYSQSYGDTAEEKNTWRLSYGHSF
jgi:hypothetical protein